MKKDEYIRELKEINYNLNELVKVTKASSTRVHLEECYEKLDKLRIEIELNSFKRQEDIA